MPYQKNGLMRRFLFSLITELVAFARNRLFILFILSGIPAVSPAVEFNTDALDADDRQNVDLSQFEKKDYISPGRYLVQITLNKNTLPGDWNVEWRATGTENGTQLCLTSDQLLQWGFNDAFVHQLNNRGQTQCLDIIDKPEFSAKLDKSTMRLTLTVPQSWMKYHAKNWTPPEYWDEGVNGALLDYNLYASQYSPHDGDNTQSFSAYGTAGVNVGAWRLRSDYQYNQNFISGNSTDTESRLARTYLFRPLPSLASKFTLGQYDLSSDIFDTFHFTGTTLESDESMLPPDLQGYAPQITGIAQTNAKVTVSQNGRVLYQTTVTPGPFTISDMVDTLQGQMDVTIEEEDGRTSTFQVGSASVPFLTRQGQLRYKTSAGKPTSSTRIL
jgi:outer membrane usher protein FimD/PapC